VRAFFYYPMRRLASARAGVVVAFVWGVAEALWWPIVPDVLVFSAGVAAPRRWWRLALAATAGSVGGGCLAYWIATGGRGEFPIASLPLVGPRMVTMAGSWLSSKGPPALLRQPLSGIPYKVFAYLAGDAHLPLAGFVLYSSVARGLRICGFAGLAAIFGAAGGERVWSRGYDLFIGVLLLAFTAGLIQVVRSF
jgi:1-acyl-sn-glycerol-3-phosphate acyltransferase